MPPEPLKPKPRPNCVSLDGMAPTGEGKQEFWVDKDKIQGFFKFGPMFKFHELKLVKELLASPAVVFQGLDRDGQEEGYCYAGLVSCRYTNQGNQLPPQHGMTFAVYMTKDFLIFRWDWEKSHAQTLTYPENYDKRYGREIWPKHS